ncbi:DUF397 domain-containing protein [Streptomyces liangshanensis]|uniref:DUF397 domain-containing protein n=1 Tax=Streptomyces liangshanensis TaxID=2717324 RepID=A0A6G9H195_9ACTN|nr:DUF397 domain-containing protein [Streptomyces liangshanensis]QIQ03981.1 DUF397 domain-containing protein [Streptomyces liangshanensis]
MSISQETSRVEWIKSSYSNTDGGNCVEFAPAALTATGLVPVRDSKMPTGPVLMLTPGAWTALVALAAETELL